MKWKQQQAKQQTKIMINDPVTSKATIWYSAQYLKRIREHEIRKNQITCTCNDVLVTVVVVVVSSNF